MVELLCASLLVLIMVGALVAVMRTNLALDNSTQQGLELQQNVRSALNFICRELINAGSGIPYLSSFNGNTLNGSPPISVPIGANLGALGTPLNSPAVYFITPGDNTGDRVTLDGEGRALAQSIQTDILTFLGGSGAFRFVDQNPPGPTSGWGAIVFLEDNSIFRLGQLVLVTNGFTASLGQITQVLPGGKLQFSNGRDELNVNSPGNGATPNPNFFSAQQQPGGPPPIVCGLSSITYFIDAATNPAHPMLKRLSNSAGGRAAATAVADDIENLQITYFVDDDANAVTPNVKIDRPNANQLSLVRGASVTVTGRTKLKRGDPNFPDRHSRLALSQTVFFRNNVRR